MRKSIHSKQQVAFVTRLREARIEANLTQASVAKKIGATQSYVSKIESGELKLGVLELQKIAKIYKKDVEFFLSP